VCGAPPWLVLCYGAATRPAFLQFGNWTNQALLCLVVPGAPLSYVEKRVPERREQVHWHQSHLRRRATVALPYAGCVATSDGTWCPVPARVQQRPVPFAATCSRGRWLRRWCCVCEGGGPVHRCRCLLQAAGGEAAPLPLPHLAAYRDGSADGGCCCRSVAASGAHRLVRKRHGFWTARTPL
jgi:hypothetical protein